ncbi:hypothetical protein [cf. Phormidesmis sp. LEGE 11477]|nr:hypothetical protein [cf. Phormidesmis sp. LEGE 11477]
MSQALKDDDVLCHFPVTENCLFQELFYTLTLISSAACCVIDYG